MHSNQVVLSAFLFFFAVASSGVAYGENSDGGCETLPVVKMKGKHGSSTVAPLFDEQTYRLTLPAGAHDRDLLVVASITRSAEDLAIRIGLQEPYSVSGLQDPESLAREIDRVHDSVVWAPEQFSLSLDTLETRDEFVMDVSASLGIEPVSLVSATAETGKAHVNGAQLAQSCPQGCCCVPGMVCCPLTTCVNCGGGALCCPTQEP